ncbi:MAG: ATPase, T2SS/T4P/T4SS family [bacterium]
MTTVPYGLRFTDILLKRGGISAAVLTQSQEKAQGLSVRLERYLLDNKLIEPAEITLALAEYLHMHPLTLAQFTPDAQLIESFPADLLKKHLALPLMKLGGTLMVALGDPFDIVVVDELHVITGLNITPLVASEKEVQDALAKVLAAPENTQGLNLEDIMRGPESEVEVGHEEKNEASLEEVMESAEGAPVIRMVNMILVEALRTRASDIHIEPQDKALRLRYRVDGGLVERPSPAKSFHAAMVSRIKIMSDLDIAERRVPQDGRFRIKALGKEVDIRVSILPSIFGEKIVMRVLDKSALFPSLGGLGLDDVSYKALSYAIDQPHGIILVTGPTGSGKTTTLYSCLQELNRPDVNIVTCEDPVEYQLMGITQVQVNANIGLTFSAALRSILRQDPDIVLIGEIRDSETAEIAVKAALTGHLVLSTLHTNDAAGAIARLIDMGIPPFLLSSSLVLSQAQRLYRKLCTACRQEVAVPIDVLTANKIDPDFFLRQPKAGEKTDVGSPKVAAGYIPIYKAVGCPKCNGTGYKGRGAIMEVLPLDEEIKQMIMKGGTSGEIREIARSKGMVTLKESGLQKVREGVTSLEAALEMTGGE